MAIRRAEKPLGLIPVGVLRGLPGRAALARGSLAIYGRWQTTTLRMLTTQLPPSSGDASIAGLDLRHEPARVRQPIGYVGQTGGADPMVSGREELILQGRLYQMSRARARARAAELIE